jgi:Xaa-Pro aminopeptidase
MMIAAVSFALAALAAAPAPPPITVPVDVYRARREKVMGEIGSCIAMLSVQSVTHGSEKRDSDFFWLTGIEEPDAWILFAPKNRYRKVQLYLAPRDPEAERWTGPRDPISPALRERYGVDAILRGRPELNALGAGLNTDCLAVIAPAREAKDERADVMLSRQVALALGLKLVYKRDLLPRLRSSHDSEELARLEQAVKISAAGHESMARLAVPGAKERDLAAELQHVFATHGGTGLPYDPIVGSGPRGAVLHWGSDDRVVQAGELVVIDSAAEYGRYAADITRTYPASGKFNEEQARAYRAVYQAQEDVFAAIKPGASMADLQKACEESLKRAGYLEHFIHGFGHFVGLDVHDAGLYEAPLPVGAVITVEPGIYRPDRGFGIRIEDEVLITESGYRLLSDGLPRRLEDVEKWIASVRR